MDILIYTIGDETTTWFRNVGKHLLSDACHIAEEPIP
jgi:hypothetical protein